MLRVDKFDTTDDLNKWLAGQNPVDIMEVWPQQITQINPLNSMPQQTLIFYVLHEVGNGQNAH